MNFDFFVFSLFLGGGGGWAYVNTMSQKLLGDFLREYCTIITKKSAILKNLSFNPNDSNELINLLQEHVSIKLCCKFFFIYPHISV